jgi:hypothetical protein
MIFISALNIPNSHTGTVEREFNRSWYTRIIVEMVFLIVIFLPGVSQATYIASLIGGNKTVVIGADSIETDNINNNKQTYVCKIITLNDHVAFTLTGYIDLFSVDLKNKVNFIDIANDAAIYFPNDIEKMSNYFADSAVERLNSKIKDWHADKLRLIADAMFGGIDEYGPKVSMAVIVYDPIKNIFYKQPVETHIKINKIITPNSHNPETLRVISGDDFQAILHSNTLLQSKKYGALMDNIVQSIIDMHLAVDIGGEPSILIIEKDKPAYWYKKSAVCPGLD